METKGVVMEEKDGEEVEREWVLIEGSSSENGNEAGPHSRENLYPSDTEDFDGVEDHPDNESTVELHRQEHLYPSDADESVDLQEEVTYPEDDAELDLHHIQLHQDHTDDSEASQRHRHSSEEDSPNPENFEPEEPERVIYERPGCPVGRSCQGKRQNVDTSPETDSPERWPELSPTNSEGSAPATPPRISTNPITMEQINNIITNSFGPASSNWADDDSSSDETEFQITDTTLRNAIADLKKDGYESEVEEEEGDSISLLDRDLGPSFKRPEAQSDDLDQDTYESEYTNTLDTLSSDLQEDDSVWDSDEQAYNSRQPCYRIPELETLVEEPEDEEEEKTLESHQPCYRNTDLETLFEVPGEEEEQEALERYLEALKLDGKEAKIVTGTTSNSSQAVSIPIPTITVTTPDDSNPQDVSIPRIVLTPPDVLQGVSIPTIILTQPDALNDTAHLPNCTSLYTHLHPHYEPATQPLYIPFQRKIYQIYLRRLIHRILDTHTVFTSLPFPSTPPPSSGCPIHILFHQELTSLLSHPLDPVPLISAESSIFITADFGQDGIFDITDPDYLGAEDIGEHERRYREKRAMAAREVHGGVELELLTLVVESECECGACEGVRNWVTNGKVMGWGEVRKDTLGAFVARGW